MSGRIVYGLDHLPRGVASDDPRLPGVLAAGGWLRLNTEPFPPPLAPAGDHAARIAAAREWIVGQCGDYAPPRRRFVAAWFAWAEAAIAAERPALAAALARFDGLYVPEDWLWSAPRPLPRAWLPGPAGPVFAEVAFRTPSGPLAVVLGEAEREAGQRAAGIAVWRPGREVLAGGPDALAAVLPAGFAGFWGGEVLPCTPFRRGLPPLARHLQHP